MPATGDRITKRKDGLFQGMYTAQTPSGPKRNYIYGRKKKDVQRRLAEAMQDFKGTVYSRAVEGGRAVIVHDLAAQAHRHPVEDQMVAAGLRGLMVAPLHYQGRVIGEIELGSPEAGAFTQFQVRRRSERFVIPSDNEMGVPSGGAPGVS